MGAALDETPVLCHTCSEEVALVDDVWIETRTCPDPGICYKALHYRHRPVDTPAVPW